MMNKKTNLIEFQDSDGNLVLIEIESDFTSDSERVEVGDSRDGNLVRVSRKFNEAVDVVRVVSKNLIERVQGMVEKPDEVDIKMGIKFSAESGAFIAKVASDANIELTLKWKKSTKEDGHTEDNS